MKPTCPKCGGSLDSDRHRYCGLNPMPHPFDVPPEITFAADMVGRWFAERNIKYWECGPCRARFSEALCSTPERMAETDGQIAGPSASGLLSKHEAIAKLAAMFSDSDHSDADDVLLAFLRSNGHSEIADAYDQLINRAGNWWYA